MHSYRTDDMIMTLIPRDAKYCLLLQLNVVDITVIVS